MTRRSILFVAENVRVFGVSKDEILRLNWTQQLPIWTGNLRAIEEEDLLSNRTSTDQTILESMNYIPSILLDDSSSMPTPNSPLDPLKPYQTLRLKLELFTGRNEVWAEIWYNPSNDQLHYHIANNGGETVQVCLDSPRHFRLIAQFPGTGYHPIEAIPVTAEGTGDIEGHQENIGGQSTTQLQDRINSSSQFNQYNHIESIGHSEPSDSNSNNITHPDSKDDVTQGEDVSDVSGSLEEHKLSAVVQVALGLEFEDLEDAWQFLEVLDRYHSKFNLVVAQYLHGRGVDGIADGILGFLLDDEDDFDDFGEFVGA